MTTSTNYGVINNNSRSLNFLTSQTKIITCIVIHYGLEKTGRPLSQGVVWVYIDGDIQTHRLELGTKGPQDLSYHLYRIVGETETVVGTGMELYELKRVAEAEGISTMPRCEYAQKRVSRIRKVLTTIYK